MKRRRAQLRCVAIVALCLLSAVTQSAWLVQANQIAASAQDMSESASSPLASARLRCVEPTPVMRREHMYLLEHQRDQTVYLGDRARRHSLAECVACHVRRDALGHTIPINAPGQFCAACHAYAAVEMDCFECHATRPDSGLGRASGKP